MWRVLACVVLAGCGRLGFEEPGGGDVTLTYPAAEVDAVLNTSAIDLEPMTTGGALAFEIAPALPAGVELDAVTGRIAGIPTAISDDVTYVVTARNADGEASVELRLTALPGSVVDSFEDLPDADGGLDATCQASPAIGCTLRAAVETANGRTGKQLVLLGPGTFHLESTLGTLANDIVIAGRGDGETIVRPLRTHGGFGMLELTAGRRLWLRRATFRDFGAVDGAVVHLVGGALHVDASRFVNNRASSSGGVFYISGGASALIERSTFTSNAAPAGNGWGGVIHAEGTNTTIVVRRSTASEYTAEWGSFSNISTGSNLILENSTLYRNTATTAGTLASPGGVYTLINDTIVFNTSTGTDSAGIFLYSAPCAYTVANSIIAFNHDSAGENNCSRRQAATTIASSGGNIFSDGAGECGRDFTGPGDRLITDPGLDASGLADHGGPTETIMLLPTSTAIDGATTTRCPALDQRGFPRPGAPASCDAGAVEVQ